MYDAKVHMIHHTKERKMASKEGKLEGIVGTVVLKLFGLQPFKTKPMLIHDPCPRLHVQSVEQFNHRMVFHFGLTKCGWGKFMNNLQHSLIPTEVPLSKGQTPTTPVELLCVLSTRL